MSPVAWVAFGTLSAAVAVLFVLLIGMTRLLEDIQRRIPAAPELGVGALAPAFRGAAIGGGTFDSRELNGAAHLIVFSHPGCLPCDELVPRIVDEATLGGLPPTVVVSRGIAGEQPETLRAAALRGRLHVVLERDDEISELFGVTGRPYAFGVDSSGRVTGRGVVNSAAELSALAPVIGTVGI